MSIPAQRCAPDGAKNAYNPPRATICRREYPSGRFYSDFSGVRPSDLVQTTSSRVVLGVEMFNDSESGKDRVQRGFFPMLSASCLSCATRDRAT